MTAYGYPAGDKTTDELRQPPAWVTKADRWEWGVGTRLRDGTITAIKEGLTEEGARRMLPYESDRRGNGYGRFLIRRPPVPEWERVDD